MLQVTDEKFSNMKVRYQTCSHCLFLIGYQLCYFFQDYVLPLGVSITLGLG